jgi:hypothetical protein
MEFWALLGCKDEVKRRLAPAEMSDPVRRLVVEDAKIALRESIERAGAIDNFGVRVHQRFTGTERGGDLAAPKRRRAS